MNNLLEQSVTLQDIVTNPWFIGVASALLYLYVGTLVRNVFIRWCLKDSHYLSEDEKAMSLMVQIFFPIALVVFLVVWIGNRCSHSIDRVAEKIKAEKEKK